MTGPTLSRADAEAIIAYTWHSEPQARAQAAICEAGGWMVEHRWPPQPFGDTGRVIVASVHERGTFACLGDICYGRVP